MSDSEDTPIADQQNREKQCPDGPRPDQRPDQRPGQMGSQHPAEDQPPDAYCTVRECEATVLRRCSQCGGEMRAVACLRESSPWLLHDRYVVWRCSACHHEQNLLSGETVVLRIAVLLGIAGLIGWMAQAGGLLNLFSVFTELTWLILPAAVAVLLLVSAVLTAWNTLLELVQDFFARRDNPRTAGPSGWGRMIKTLILGAVPWLLAFLIGLFDFYVHDVNETLAFLMLPFIFAPVFLAPRVGLSQMGTFLAALFWVACLWSAVLFAEPVSTQSESSEEPALFKLWIAAPGQECIAVQVELASDRQTRRVGLMGRHTMAPEQGMLFVWEYPHLVRMWMHKTLIPLDMWFIDENGQVVQINERRDTQSKQISRAAQPVPMVLELNAGFARDRGLTAHSGLRVALPERQRQTLSHQMADPMSAQMLSYLSAASVQCDRAEH